MTVEQRFWLPLQDTGNVSLSSTLVSSTFPRLRMLPWYRSLLAFATRLETTCIGKVELRIQIGDMPVLAKQHAGNNMCWMLAVCAKQSYHSG